MVKCIGINDQAKSELLVSYAIIINNLKNGILSIYFVETDKKNTYENLIQIKNTFSDIKAIEIIDDTQSRAIYPQLFW